MGCTAPTKTPTIAVQTPFDLYHVFPSMISSPFLFAIIQNILLRMFGFFSLQDFSTPSVTQLSTFLRIPVKTEPPCPAYPNTVLFYPFIPIAPKPHLFFGFVPNEANPPARLPNANTRGAKEIASTVFHPILPPNANGAATQEKR